MSKKNNMLENYFLHTLRIFLSVLALCVAYVCNNRSKKHNKYFMVIVAFLFPEIYLSQVAVRYFILKDYSC